ncbi:MAG: hypothetical protein PHI27_09890 [Eubacteriales bacterium]|nr:hypothetical protein [Eubacteriales bacterium]MDD3882554.1 hypothetical protein [Eubacteriales bacterium]MDD4512853.1 hypothetical protein [Eubacteriales bacterium]
MKRLSSLIILLALLSGCAPALEESLPALMLGVEEKDGKISVCARMPKANGETGEKGYVTIESSGASAKEALQKLRSENAYSFHLSGLRALIISDSLSPDSLRETLDALWADGIRGRAAVIGASEAVKDLIDAVNAEVGMRLSRYLDEKFERATATGALPDSTVFTLERALEVYGQRNIAARCAKGGSETAMDELMLFSSEDEE